MSPIYVIGAVIIILLAWKYNIIKDVHKRIFAYCLCKITPGYNKSVSMYKKSLFTTIDDVLKYNSGELFEIGAGSGGSLYYYPKDYSISLTVLEPNVHCKQYLEKQLNDYPNIALKKYITNVGEDMKDVASNSVSCLVCTIVLCSVENPKKVLQEVKRVLKPGGKFFFMEHVAADNGTWLKLFQNILNTPWTYIADGCNLTRDTSKVIQEAGFTEVTLEKFNSKALNIMRLIRPHVYGWAMK